MQVSTVLVVPLRKGGFNTLQQTTFQHRIYQCLTVVGNLSKAQTKSHCSRPGCSDHELLSLLLLHSSISWQTAPASLTLLGPESMSYSCCLPLPHPHSQSVNKLCWLYIQNVLIIHPKCSSTLCFSPLQLPVYEPSNFLSGTCPLSQLFQAHKHTHTPMHRHTTHVHRHTHATHIHTHEHTTHTYKHTTHTDTTPDTLLAKQ